MERSFGKGGWIALALCCVFAATGCVSYSDSAPAKESIVFLHTNDEHGAIENYGRIAWMAEQLADTYDHVFLVSAGDLFSGSPVVDQYIIDGEDLRGRPIVDLMNRAGYDVAVIGNHEFDYGQLVLQERIAEAEFPLILANVDAHAALLDQPAPYVTLSTDAGTRVTFLGLLEVTPEEIPSTHPANLAGLEFYDPVDTAREYLYLADESDLLVGLTHLGFEWDKELAQTVGAFDLIFGGHCHTAIQSPQLHNDVLIAQAGEHAEYLGKVVVEISAEGDIVRREGQLIPIGEIGGTVAQIEQRIAYYQAQVEETFARPLIELPQPLAGNAELGSLMSDAIVETLEADFAFANHGGIRVDELAGVLTVGDIFDLEPFGNEIVIFDMEPDDIRSLISYAYARFERVDLQPGKLHYSITVDEDGDILAIELSYPDGTPLDETAVYTVGLGSYVAATYQFTARNEGVNTHRPHNELIVEYIEALEPDELSAYSGISRARAETLLPEDIDHCITWDQAAEHVGDILWVQGPVAGVFRTVYDRVFINIPVDYPNQEFVIMVHEQHVSTFDDAFGQGFESRLVGETVCVFGRVETFGGVPQILPTSPDHLRSRVLESACPGGCLPQ